MQRVELHPSGTKTKSVNPVDIDAGTYTRKSIFSVLCFRRDGSCTGWGGWGCDGGYGRGPIEHGYETQGRLKDTGTIPSEIRMEHVPIQELRTLHHPGVIYE